LPVPNLLTFVTFGAGILFSIPHPATNVAKIRIAEAKFNGMQKISNCGKIGWIGRNINCCGYYRGGIDAGFRRENGIFKLRPRGFGKGEGRLCRA
jgi:hypothetical protein